MSDDIPQEQEIPIEQESDIDEAKEYEDLEREDLPPEVDEMENDDENKKFIDHGKGYKRPIKVDLNEKEQQTS